jgi:hypothetical protein
MLCPDVRKQKLKSDTADLKSELINGVKARIVN